MKAALMAPSSKRSNPWQFVVVDDKDTLKKLSLCKEQASQFIADAALAVVVMADPLASDVWIEDASIASIYLQLQAEDMGLGSCWVQVRERVAANGLSSDEYVHDVLGIPLQFQVLRVRMLIQFLICTETACHLILPTLEVPWWLWHQLELLFWL